MSRKLQHQFFILLPSVVAVSVAHGQDLSHSQSAVITQNQPQAEFLLADNHSDHSEIATEHNGNSPALQVSRLSPLVVTAELLDRPLQVSGQSVEIFDQESLADQVGLNTLRDVLDQVPNISLVTGTGKAPTVRGVDGTGPAENANAFFAGSRPRLSWQIDHRPASYNEVVFGDLGLFDVERIEVLRGPQSSLVGRNAIAGTVMMKTHDPEFQSAGKLRLAAGNYDQKQASGMFNVPLSNKVALRVSADWLQKDSAVSYDSFSGVSDPKKIDGLSVRSKLLILPDTERDSRLLFTLSRSAYAGPNGEIIVRPFTDRRSNYPQQPRHEPKTTSLGLDYELELNDQWQFRLNTSTTEFDFTRTAVPGTSNATIDTREYVFEPQLRYSRGGQSAVAGVYYYQARQKEYIEFFGGQSFKDDTDTLAAYVEGILPVTDTLDLSAGVRYEQEDRQRDGGDPTRTVVNISSDKTYHAFLPKLGLNWQPSDDISWGVQVSEGYNAGGGGITFSMPIVNYEYDKETVWTYELYGRQQFAEGRIRTTQNLFYSRYKDMQLPFDLTPEDSRDEAFVVRNANKVETTGLELGIEARLTPSVDLWGSLGLLDTEVSDFSGSGIEGNQLLTAPEVTANMGMAWHQNGWRASMNHRFSDRYYSDVNNRPGGKTDPYVVTDVSLSYEVGAVRLFGSVKNLFDTEKPVARYQGVAPADSNEPDSAFDSAVLLQPRTFLAGIELSY